METATKAGRSTLLSYNDDFGFGFRLSRYTPERLGSIVWTFLSNVFLARFSCVRHLELRSRHQARRPREKSNLNIATCFLRRSRKIWGERDGHFEGPCWLSGGAIVGEPWLHRCGYITLLRAFTWQGSVFVTCNDARTHGVVATKFPFFRSPLFLSRRIERTKRREEMNFFAVVAFKHTKLTASFCFCRWTTLTSLRNT